jgi:large subunit ribosomal protein L35
MPKQKTKKAVVKRFKRTATGKLRGRHSGSSHLMSGKNAKRRRRLRKSTIITGATAEKVKTLLGK